MKRVTNRVTCLTLLRRHSGRLSTVSAPLSSALRRADRLQHKSRCSAAERLIIVLRGVVVVVMRKVNRHGTSQQIDIKGIKPGVVEVENHL
jgi:hypothetical protein